MLPASTASAAASRRTAVACGRVGRWPPTEGRMGLRPLHGTFGPYVPHKNSIHVYIHVLKYLGPSPCGEGGYGVQESIGLSSWPPEKGGLVSRKEPEVWCLVQSCSAYCGELSPLQPEGKAGRR